jgi:hypothetical protein
LRAMCSAAWLPSVLLPFLARWPCFMTDISQT